MTEFRWLLDVVPPECWLEGKTSGRESGIGFRFTARSGDYRLCHTDSDAFRRALGLVGDRCCDYALFWSRRAAHCTAIELKGGSLSRAISQAEGLLDAVRRSARGRPLKPSAIIIFRGRLNRPLLQRLIGKLRRNGIDVHIKTVKRGNVDIDPILNRIDAP